jgi:hypothetical protein
VLLAAAAGEARGQFAQQQPPGWHPGPNVPDLDQFQASEETRRKTEFVTNMWLFGLIIGVAATILSVVAAVVVRCRATTDPRKLAMSDPWLRARLEAMNAAPSDNAPIVLAEEAAPADSAAPARQVTDIKRP